MSGAPWDSQFIATVGASQYVKIPAPCRGNLTKLVVTGGAGFTVDVFNSVLANPADPATVDANGIARQNPAVYQVMAQISDSGGVAAVFGIDRPYWNQDAFQNTRGGYLVLRINGGVGDYAVGIGVSSFSLV